MISIFIPALNEEKNLPLTIKMLFSVAEKAGLKNLDIIVVNDGSRDSTREVLDVLVKKYPKHIRAIHHDTNEGIGTSLQQALSLAREKKFMIVPGNNDVPPELLKTLFAHRDISDMVLSYYLNKEDRGRFRNILSVQYGLIYMTMFKISIQYMNGVSLYPTGKLKSLSLISRRFSIVSEINVKLLRSGCTFHEIAGFMQQSTTRSTALSLKNIIEVCLTFTRLVIEIHVTRRAIYDKRPVRVYTV